MFLMTSIWYQCCFQGYENRLTLDTVSFAPSGLRLGVRHAGLDFKHHHPTPRKESGSDCHCNCHGQHWLHPGLLYLALQVRAGPLYVQPFGAEIAILGVASLSALGLRFYLRSLNRKLEAKEVSSGLSRRTDEGPANDTKNSNVRYLY